MKNQATIAGSSMSEDACDASSSSALKSKAKKLTISVLSFLRKPKVTSVLRKTNNDRIQFLSTIKTKQQRRRFAMNLNLKQKTRIFWNGFIQLMMVNLRMLLIRTYLPLGKLSIKQRSQEVVKRISKTRNEILGRDYQNESNIENETLASVKTFVYNITPLHIRNTLTGIILTTSLASFIISVALFIKHRGTLIGSQIALTLITFLSTILLACDIDQELIEQVTNTLMTNTSAIMGPELINNKLRRDDDTEGGILNEHQVKYLYELEKMDNLTKSMAIKHYEENYKDLTNVKFLLPLNLAPSSRLVDLRTRRDEFEYPDWFLRLFWGEPTNLGKLRRLLKLTSKHGIDENIHSDNGETTDADIEEYLKEQELSKLNVSMINYNEIAELGEKVVEKLRRPRFPDNCEDYECEDTTKFWRPIQKLLKKVVCILIYTFDCSTSKQKFTLGGLIKSFRLMDDLKRESSDLKDLYNIIVGKETSEEMLTNKFEEYRKEFDTFMETPTFKFAENPKLMYRMKSLLSEFNTFTTTLSRESKQDYLSVIQLSVMVNTKIHNYFQNDIVKVSRQEPFIVLIQGAPAGGKTYLSRQLAKDICTKVLGEEYQGNVIDVTPDDKYWPPFGGQSVAFFDDCGSPRDLEKDLLFKSAKNICSTQNFNAAGADLSHKINPINFKVIVATTNTTFKELGTRITTMYDAASAEAIMRRMICIEAKWNPQAGQVNIHNPSQNNYKANFSHLTLQRCYYNQGVVSRDAIYTYDRLLREIQERENGFRKQHHMWLKSLGMENQASRTHYSVVLHGRAGQGKTHAARNIAKDLTKATGMKFYEFGEHQTLKNFKPKERAIILLDDIVRHDMTTESEEIIMDLYNSRLPNGSVIINTTNLSPSWSLPVFSLTSWITQRKLPFVLEGLTRRIGFFGYFKGVQQPITGIELRVNNMRYYQVNDQTAITLQMWAQAKLKWILIGLSILLHVYITYIPFIHIIICLFYFRMLESEIENTKLSTIIFDKYKQFLNVRNAIQAQYVEVLPKPDKCNLIIHCQDRSEFMKVNSSYEANEHVFTNLANFYSSTKSWKIFMSPEVLTEMQKNLERYMLSSYEFDDESVINLISRYATAFNACGITPQFYAYFNGIAEYAFFNQTLYIKHESNNSDDIGIPKPTIIYLSGEYYVDFMGQTFSFGEITTLTFESPMVNHLTFNQSQVFFGFIKSQEFLSDIRYIQYVRKRTYSDIQSKLIIYSKIFTDNFTAFVKTPLGGVCLALVAILSIGVLISLLKTIFGGNKKKNSYRKRREAQTTGDESDSDSESDGSLITSLITERKHGKKGSPKRKSYDSDDDKTKERKHGKKGSPKKKSYDSDDDKVKERKHGKKGSPKKKSYDSDDDRKPEASNYEQQDVLTLRDVNDFQALKPYFSTAHAKARKNLCQIYYCNSNEKILKEEPGAILCYGLFIKNSMMVTVGHVTNDMKSNLYVGMDGLAGFRKATFICRPNNRDLSIWHVPGINNQTDISNFFLKDNFYNVDHEWNAVLQRFAPGKIEEFHVSTFYFFPGPQQFSSNGQLTKFGAAEYASFGIKLTDGGDCGLPYYVAETLPTLSNKILGIHCMGNVMGAKSSGILSIITQEDIKDWDKKYSNTLKEQSNLCCTLGTSKLVTKPDSNPKCAGHLTTWNKTHESSWITFLEEYNHFVFENPKFVGGIIKNSGTLWGTQKHSHTQFLPYMDNVVTTDISSWKTIDLSVIRDELEGNGSQITVEIDEQNFASYLKKYHRHGNDFRIRAYRFKPVSKTASSYKIRMQITITEDLSIVNAERQINGVELTQQNTLTTYTPNFGSPIHVDPALYAVLDGAIRNKQRGILEDVPFCDTEDNQTVKVIGSFMQSKSHVPNNHYKRSPFSRIVKDIIPEDKAPCEYDLSKIPDEVKEKLVKNRFGQPCQRSTLSLAWAHKIMGSPMDLRKIKEEFRIKVKSFYSGLRLLTDDEVLSGFKTGNYVNNLKGLELDTSIGFSMKELFYVSKKNDVITCDENGNYHWLNNPAAIYLKNMYEQTKMTSDRGEKYFACFLELLKMEKLKIEGGKMYKGRTFVAQDILGVLMERRNLGHFCAKAYKDDPNCGIGSDPIKDFNKIYMRLNKFPNLWAGDYKNYDRNTPAVVQKVITELLCETNPKIANQIRSTMNVNIERIQISGTTLFEVYGGLPSGCFATAPMNSLNNEFLMYSCFHMLCEENGIAPSWKLYNENVERFYYGDDVIISVSDEFAEIFTRKNVSKIMLEYFGMVLDSSAKDGSETTFDNYETASWISRFFRPLIKYPIYCGALKKISIHANFHHVSSVALPHLGSLMERAQYEAALWEPEFFEKIQQAIILCIREKPALAKYVQVYSQTVIQEEMYHQSILTAFDFTKQKQLDWASEVEETTSLQENLINFTDRYYFRKSYLRLIKKMQNNIVNENKAIETPVSYSMMLNEQFQKGNITKPQRSFSKTGPANNVMWTCEIECKVAKDCTLQQGTGFGTTKAIAQEEASYIICHNLGITERLQIRKTVKIQRPEINLKNYKQEMNVSAATVGHVPSAPLVQTDVSVVSDSGLFTNTLAPTPQRIFNQCAIALDNPAGSGAPFDKKTSCYNIYQRWESKNTTISPSMSAGARVLTLSLDPNDWPKYIKEYVLFHDSIIPAIEIVISIAGAAGTIGWLTTGWVKDGSKTDISLSDLQQIASETTNMNGTQIIKTSLTDVRRTGLYRKTKEDPEPYPAIIMLIDHAVTNVQRNDSVNYPVRVQMRLHQSCILMEPFNSPDNGPSTTKFNLGSYFYDNRVDLLVGSSGVTETPTLPETYPDYGYNTKDFEPKLGKKAQAAIWNYPVSSAIMCVVDDPTPTQEVLDQLQNQTGNPQPEPQSAMPPMKLVFSYGTVDYILDASVEGKDISLLGSVYSLSIPVYISKFRYTITQLIAQDQGCYLVAEIDYNHQQLSGKDYIIFTNCATKAMTQSWLDATYQPKDYVDSTAVYFYKDVNHNNVIVGDDFNVKLFKVYNIDWDSNTEFPLDSYPQVFVQTGNSMPATQLPTGTKQLCFVRGGTTTRVAQDLPFVPITKPILPNAFTALDRLMAEENYKMIKANLIINGENRGQIGYRTGVLFVRTDSYKVILAGVGNDIMLENITTLATPQALDVFNTTGYASWVSGGKRTRPRINFNDYELQASIAGGAVMGLGMGISEFAKQQFQMQMMERLNKANAALQGANNAALAQRQKDAFERNLQLTGYNSSSAQFGLIGPRQENQMNTNLYRNLDSSFHRGETINPDTTTQGNVTFDNQVGNAIIDVSKEPKSDEVTQMITNPAFEPAPRNKLIENQAVEDLEPANPALDKESTVNNHNIKHI